MLKNVDFFSTALGELSTFLSQQLMYPQLVSEKSNRCGHTSGDIAIWYFHYKRQCNFKPGRSPRTAVAIIFSLNINCVLAYCSGFLFHLMIGHIGHWAGGDCYFKGSYWRLVLGRWFAVSTPVGRFELGKLRPSRRDHLGRIGLEDWEQERLRILQAAQDLLTTTPRTNTEPSVIGAILIGQNLAQGSFLSSCPCCRYLFLPTILCNYPPFSKDSVSPCLDTALFSVTVYISTMPQHGNRSDEQSADWGNPLTQSPSSGFTSQRHLARLLYWCNQRLMSVQQCNQQRLVLPNSTNYIGLHTQCL